MARDRAVLTVVGTPQLDVPREPFFRKELQLRIARAYGPGRYDPQYEENGTDYPIGYVRWTEQRNMAEFLRLVARKLVRPAPLISHQFEFTRAPEAYELLQREPAGALGVVLHYGASANSRARGGEKLADAHPGAAIHGGESRL